MDLMTQQAVDVVIPWLDRGKQDDQEDDHQMIEISRDTTQVRPLYLMKRKTDLPHLRQQLRTKHRLLLSVFNSYAYYSCDITEMEEKVLAHMTRTNAYLLITAFHRHHPDDKTYYLNKIDEQMTLTLNQLLKDRSITLLQWQKMKVVDRSRNQLDSLYFLPDTHQENVPFHPMSHGRHGLTMKLSRFLHDLLQPIYDRVSYTTTFQTSADVMDVLEKYAEQGYLRAQTLFATLHIHDLTSSIPQAQLIETLQRFLNEYIIDGYVQGITIENILQLTRLFLDHQYMLYDNKLYQQIRGSAYNSPLTTILANIYMYYWQEDLITRLNKNNELFGRYFDQVFFAWNESPDHLQDLLHTMHEHYPDLHMTMTIKDNIDYLDIHIRHMDGILKTQIAHPFNTTEPYALPYIVGHPRYQYQTLPEAAVFRAARCCTDMLDFAHELHDLQLSFQYNGFPKHYFRHRSPFCLEDFRVPDFEGHRYDSLRQLAFNDNRQRKKARIKRCQRQTIQYRWPLSLYHDIDYPSVLIDQNH